MSIRDTQRAKLYAAEKPFHSTTTRRETVAEMQAFVDKVMKRAPLVARYGPHLIRPVVVKDGRRCRSALGGTHWIKMPRWSRCDLIILHELAHAITRRKYGDGVAAHGREYAAIYLDLIHFGIGADAMKALRARFIECRVKYKPKRVVDRSIGFAKKAA